MTKTAFEWNIYNNRKTALQYLKQNSILIDTILETDDGSACEYVHSQVISAFGDKLSNYINENGQYVDSPAPPPLIPAPPTRRETTHGESTSSSLAPAAETTIITNASGSGSAGSSEPTTTTTTTLKTTTFTNTSTHTTTSTASPIPLRTTSNNDFVDFNKTNIRMKRIRLPRVNKYTLGILVDCAYTGYIRTDLPSGGIWQVLEMAEFYEMNEVSRACCLFLSKNLNRSNCINFYHIGIRHRHPLQRNAFHQIRANFKYLLADDLAKKALPQNRNTNNNNNNNSTTSNSKSIPQPPSLSTIKYDHFEALLMDDKLNVDNEESVWLAIRFWCNQNNNQDPPRLAALLPCIRFPRFRTGTEFSAKHIWRDPLVMNNKRAQHQLAVLDRNHRDYLTSPVYQLTRDGFNLPCAPSPRQLKPRIPHSILLAIGGWQQGQPTTMIEAYDVNCNLWFESARKIMVPLAYHGIENIDGLLYICGGTNGSEILNELFTFNPISGSCAQKLSMYEPRCYVSTAYLNGYLYAMGGHNGNIRMKSVERYDVANETWFRIKDMNVARSDASSCVHEQLIYIAGGLNDQLIESSVEFYNHLDNTWTFIRSMITPRTSFTLLLYQQTLLAIGGNNGQERLASVEQYNFKTRTWSHHSNMRHRRSTFSAALLEENKLIVVGGYNGQTPFNQVEMFEEESRSWIMLHKIRHDRSGLKVVVVSDLANASDYTYLGSVAAATTTTAVAGSGGNNGGATLASSSSSSFAHQ